MLLRISVKHFEPDSNAFAADICIQERASYYVICMHSCVSSATGK